MLPKWPEITWLYSNKNGPFVLGINPWVYDFAAFNLWSRPLGLVSVLSYFSKAGANVALLDCMYKTWEDVPWPKVQKYGTGHYPRVFLPRPSVFEDLPRKFARYGLPRDMVKMALKGLTPQPDLILITSIMTYWYPGVVAICSMVRDIWPDTPVVVGGIYASLCFEHASKLLNDFGVDVIDGPVEVNKNWFFLWNKLNISPLNLNRDFDLSIQSHFYPGREFAVLMLSRGCPFRCDYCASRLIYPKFVSRDPDKVFDEFMSLFNLGIRDFVFYDDALLVEANDVLIPFLEKVIAKRLHVKFHTPNGLHVKYLDKSLCVLLKRAGFTTIRLGLETSNFNNRWDKKITEADWEKGLYNLSLAGFSKEQIGVYILFGVPNQKDEEVIEAIKFVKSYGLRTHLAYYSPIPKTKMFEEARKCSVYPLEDEPLTHNRSVWPCYKKGFSWEERARWRALI